jgi:hypothetical protein
MYKKHFYVVWLVSRKGRQNRMLPALNKVKDNEFDAEKRAKLGNESKEKFVFIEDLL